jgi:hypothetical protein
VRPAGLFGRGPRLKQVVNLVPDQNEERMKDEGLNERFGRLNEQLTFRARRTPAPPRPPELC